MSKNGFSPGSHGACLGWRKALAVAGLGFLFLAPSLRAVDGAPDFVSDDFPIRLLTTKGADLVVTAEAPPHVKVKVLRRIGDKLLVEYQGYQDQFDASRFSFCPEMISYWVGRAVVKYPQLAVKDSAFSQGYRALYAQVMDDQAARRAGRPAAYTGVVWDDWPLHIADMVAKDQGAGPVQPPSPSPAANAGNAGNAVSAAVPMVKEDGVLKLPVKINDAIQLKFIVDSGAADVQIPEDVFSTLTRTDTILKRDMLSPAIYGDAGGKQTKRPRFVLRSLRIGNVTLTDVRALVGEANSPLLLGQSFLSRFKEWKIDNQANTIVLKDPLDPSPGMPNPRAADTKP